MIRVYLALGSNLGDRRAALEVAITGLHDAVAIDAVSRSYETAPMYVTDQPPFINMVVSGLTDLAPLALLDRIKDLEREIGRVPSIVNGPRAIDIDILYHGETVMQSERLVLPHPRIAERAFVLAPLADIAPDLIGPTERRTTSELLAAVAGIETIKPCE